MISINYHHGTGAYLEAADKQLERVCQALKVVIVGQSITKPNDLEIHNLAEDLGIPTTIVQEKISKVYAENI